MIGTLGMGSPGTQFGQSTLGQAPFGTHPFAAPFALQSSPYLQSQQQSPFGPGQGAYANPQLLQIVPQQLGHLSQMLQQQLHGLQQLLQIVPQQLHQIQQLLQVLPHQIQQLQQQSQPFGAQATQGFNQWQQPIGAGSSWGQPTTGVNIGSPGFPGQSGPVM